MTCHGDRGDVNRDLGHTKSEVVTVSLIVIDDRFKDLIV